MKLLWSTMMILPIFTVLSIVPLFGHCFNISQIPAIPQIDDVINNDVSDTMAKRQILRKCSGDFEVDLDRIYGGQDATPNEFPHQASLQVRYLNSHFCGGTLLNDRWIMSAAHCFYKSKYPFNYQVKLGEHNLVKKDPTERLFKVDKVIVHEKYTDKQEFDIALLRLANRLNFTGSEKHLKPICLAETDVQKDYYCVATGWGRGNKGPVVTNVLQKLPQPIHNSTRCSRIWKNSRWPITKDHICIGDLKGSKGVCNGDSGGPVQCRLRNGEWVQFGIASWTISDCVSKGYAAVFTKVSSYRGWIEQQIRKYP